MLVLLVVPMVFMGVLVIVMSMVFVASRANFMAMGGNKSLDAEKANHP